MTAVADGTLTPGAFGPVSARLEPASASWQRRLSRRLVGLDLGLAAFASAAALLARFGDTVTTAYAFVALAFPFGFVLAVAAARGYDDRYLGSGTEEFRRVADASVRYLAVAATLAYALKYDLARGFVLLAFPLAAGLVLIGRYSVRRWLHVVRRSGRYGHRVLVLGRERSAAEMIRQLRTQTDAGFNVVGACIDGSPATDIEGVPVLGLASRDVLRALALTQADTVAVAAWSPLSQGDLRRLSWQLEGTGVDLVVAPSLTDVAGPRIHIRPVAGLPLLHVEQPELSGGRRVLKGAFDRVVAALALIVLLPLLLATAVLVRLDSRGPALFLQERVGRNGSRFTMVKFRSMRVTAEEELAALQAHADPEHVLFKLPQDPRVTRVGAVLRRFSLDELPQLLNVLKGEMSLVGPRPPLPSEVSRYEDAVHRRLLVKPGLTGLWQVSGRADLSWQESVRLDLHYVENWSLSFDLVIIAKTVLAVARRQGAY
jgi:exopolysaccharide biosynthesis polyprenyl glycosylphosphotransferase